MTLRSIIPKDQDYRISTVKTIILKWSFPLELLRLKNYFREVEEIIFNNSRFSDRQLLSIFNPLYPTTIRDSIKKFSVNYEKYVSPDNTHPKISISTCVNLFPMLHELNIDKVLQHDSWPPSMEYRIVRLC